jgi:hypothetical protein
MNAQEVVAFLASQRRTVLLGGMAVILHGLSRSTKDIDIWMDPIPDVDTWLTPLRRLLPQESSLRPERIGDIPGAWKEIAITDLPAVANEDRLIRISGVDRPIDVFYVPNER